MFEMVEPRQPFRLLALARLWRPYDVPIEVHPRPNSQPLRVRHLQEPASDLRVPLGRGDQEVALPGRREGWRRDDVVALPYATDASPAKR